MQSGVILKRQIKPLPYRAYFCAVLFLVITGWIASLYLAHSHYKNYADLQYQSFCAISNAINCDTVSQSPYSIIFIPIPIWGVIGYTLLMLLMPCAWGKEFRDGRMWSLFLWIALTFTCISISLAIVSTYLIGSYCILCIVTYLVNLFLLCYGWLIRRRFATQGLIQDTCEDFRFIWQRRRRFLPILSAFIAVVIVLIALLPPYWHMKPPRLSRNIPSGLTDEGHPWMGATNPATEISLFSDYQCFQCKKMHVYLREIIAQNPQKIRLIHRHYPMDHEFNFIVKAPFHVGSGKMALLAIYAASKGKFWEMNDLLFEIAGRQKQIDLKWVAEKTGLETAELLRALRDPVIRNMLSRDVWQGMKLRIYGTPTFVIDGKVYSGNIPSDILNKYLGQTVRIYPVSRCLKQSEKIG